MLFDTHCHFDSIEDARAQLPRAYEAGVRAINVIGCDLETSQLSIDVVKLIEAERAELGLDELDAQATIGLHPHEAKFLSEQKDALERLTAENFDIICGIGETGYDFYYDHSERNEQTKAFLWQVKRAKELDRTMVVHTREAWDETFQLLDEQGWPKRSVMHCFTGGPVEALRSVEHGAYISISGISTFKNAQDIRDAIEVVPLDRLLVETDAPWLAPVPHRGETNEPGYVSLVADQVVQIRTKLCDETEDEVRSALFSNAMRAFR
jgi:TatD DNase family protein